MLPARVRLADLSDIFMVMLTIRDEKQDSYGHLLLQGQ